MASTTVLALNVHAGFACRRSGACCTAGWPIPVEPAIARLIRADHGLTDAALDEAPPLPDGAAAVIRPLPSGACPFFEANGRRSCAIQQRLGHGSLPASCRHFPRVTLLEPDAVRVSLSHFCPTAASMLFRDDIERLQVVPDAAGLADRDEHDGFDARQTIPPFLRPGVAMDLRTCRTWEQHLLDALGTGGAPPEDALAGVAFTTERIRAWTSGPALLEDHAAQAVEQAADVHRQCDRWTMSLANASRLFLIAAHSIPGDLARPGMPGDADAADRTWVLPQWRTLARPVGRYLAARSFAAWSAYLGDGLRTQVAMLAAALAVVRVEAVRQTARAGRPLDATLVRAAVSSADLLLQHLSDPAALAESFAGVEELSFPAWLAAMGLEAAR